MGTTVAIRIPTGGRDNHNDTTSTTKGSQHVEDENGIALLTAVDAEKPLVECRRSAVHSQNS